MRKHVIVGEEFRIQNSKFHFLIVDENFPVLDRCRRLIGRLEFFLPSADNAFGGIIIEFSVNAIRKWSESDSIKIHKTFG